MLTICTAGNMARRDEARPRPRRTHLVHQHLAQDLELLELRPRRSVDDRAHRVRDGGLGLGGSALVSASILLERTLRFISKECADSRRSVKEVEPRLEHLRVQLHHQLVHTELLHE